MTSVWKWLYKRPAGLNGHMSIKDSTLIYRPRTHVCTMADSGRHFFYIKDTVILYKVLSIFVVKSQLNRQFHMYMYNSCTDNFH